MAGLFARAVGAGAALAVSVLLGACGADDGPSAGAPEVRPITAETRAATPERHTGPQGNAGQFVAHCRYSHSGPHDPIVHPGHAGASHLHDFYGATTLDESTTPADMLEADTTCDKRADTAGYWHPTLLNHGEVVVPLDLNAYYRAAPGVEPTAVETMPLGLALIAGDQAATEAQAGEAVGWTCGTRTTLSALPPTCSAGAPLHLVLTFQDCWDGLHVASEDHVSHVAYSTGGRCPESHPVHIPQLTMSVRFPVFGEGHDLAFSSGSIHSAHGDFFNGWDPDGLEREIRACIHRDVVCNLASNRLESELFRPRSSASGRPGGEAG